MDAGKAIGRVSRFHRPSNAAVGRRFEGLRRRRFQVLRQADRQAGHHLEELPDEIRSTYDKLGIPEAEKSRLVSGVAAQYESEVIYNSIQKDLEEQGVIFVDTDTAVQKYPELVKKYFGKCIPSNDNKFSALNTAAWSGGSFVYVPKGVHVDIPLQAYFRINTPNMGQFERTLIIADEGSYVHYVEGCTAPIYSTDSLHSGVVEIFVEPHARVRYTTVQNWSNNVYNLVTQRATCVRAAPWNGSTATSARKHHEVSGMHPRRAVREGSTMSLGFAGKGQYQDTGAKMIHLAPHTSSTIVAKSISRGGGRSAYRGLVKIVKGAEGSSNSTSATLCSSTNSAVPTRTRMWMCVRTTSPWRMRPPFPRSLKTSCSI